MQEIVCIYTLYKLVYNEYGIEYVEAQIIFVKI